MVKFQKILSALTLFMTLGISVPSLADDTIAEFQKTLALAQNGDLVAQFNLGNKYKTGQGVAQDYSKAMDWYQSCQSRLC